MNSLFTRAILAAVVTTVSVAYANAQQFQATLAQNLGATLSGLNEVPPISSTGQGTLTLELNTQQQSLRYTLTYSNLRAQVTQAHIHFGQIHVDGGIMVFLCSNLTNPPPATPPCPTSGPVMGMLTASSVIGPAAQGISAGDFDALATALLSRTAYGNVHTVLFPAGEIRGEIRRPGDQSPQQ